MPRGRRRSSSNCPCVGKASWKPQRSPSTHTRTHARLRSWNLQYRLGLHGPKQWEGARKTDQRRINPRSTMDGVESSCRVSAGCGFSHHPHPPDSSLAWIWAEWGICSQLGDVPFQQGFVGQRDRAEKAIRKALQECQPIVRVQLPEDHCGLVGWTRRCATQIPFRTGSSCSASSCHLLPASLSCKEPSHHRSPFPGQPHPVTEGREVQRHGQFLQCRTLVGDTTEKLALQTLHLDPDTSCFPPE